jgi:hypothetical protein
MKKLLVIALAIGAMTSCSKSDSSTSTQLEISRANIAGVYRITADVVLDLGITYDKFNGGTNGGTTYAGYPDCKKDDTYTFTTTDVITAEGANLCTPATASTTSTYAVQPSSKYISALGITGTIESLTANKMVIKVEQTVMGDTFVRTITFSK